MKNKLTIVLTLKDRSDFTIRWMQYMNDQDCPYKILIADGGADKSIERHLQDSKSYKNLDYEYVRYPYDINIINYYKKLNNICEKVKTEYLLLADNDDFYLIDKIPEYINFLDSNPNYVGCRGASALFSLKSKKGETLNACQGDKYVAILLKEKSIEDKDSISRLSRFFNEIHKYDHWFNWYCVIRKRSIVKSMNILFKYQYYDIVLNEILFALLILHEGKIKVFRNLFYLRQDGTSQLTARNNEKYNLLENFIINDVFYNFKNFITSEDIIFEEKFRIEIIKKFALFIAEWCIQSSKYKEYRLFQWHLNSIKSKLSRNLYSNFFLILLKSLIFGKVKKVIKLKIIENYILKRKKI
jgi:hypothetical protein